MERGRGHAGVAARRLAGALGALVHAGLVLGLALLDGRLAGCEIAVAVGLAGWGVVELGLCGAMPSSASWRAAAPLALGWGLTVVAAMTAHDDPRLVGVAVIGAGLALRGSALLALRGDYGDGVPPTSRQLVVRGPYALSRHPGELGALLMAYGLGVLLASPLAVLATTLVLLPATLLRLRAEDAALDARHGEAHRAYVARVGWLGPRIIDRRFIDRRGAREAPAEER